MPKRTAPAGSRQRWATFFRNHLYETLAVDFAVVPTATFGILYVFFVLSLDRVDGLGLEQIRTALRSPWQNGFAERWIASLRRDCLDHVIPINERQLRRVIRSYVDYYHADRTHLGLKKDATEKRSIEPREMGKVVALPRVGGLHHRYTRELQRAA
jgi:putative transposase